MLSNANKHTPVETNISVKLQVEDTYILMSVEDDGPGITLVDQDRVFNAYYRNSAGDGKGANQSSGLGLSIAKYLAELHGGRIWLDSEPGRGTTFYFTLPLGDTNEDISD